MKRFWETVRPTIAKMDYPLIEDPIVRRRVPSLGPDFSA
jgi:hypothetical protein